ncbi:FAD/NAD(P)-binding protein [Neorhizobium sp. NPDC001467]|uniref:FAD/NAD(P)-binding protein n=1 Tax=Neorhizobium sp. NPDC001467 TaxID=3390595 RepID=UPI003D05D5AD
MGGRVCIIGSGPTGIFTLQRLGRSEIPLSITLFEAEAQAGKGTPYLPGNNDPAMLSNIPSIEIPPLPETLVDWLNRRNDDYLDSFAIIRSRINGRQFYPRLVLGDYLQDQFQTIVRQVRARGHAVDIRAGHRVSDIALGLDEIRLSVIEPGGEFGAVFDHVVMATGHNWAEDTQVAPGYFASPWPAAALKSACSGRLGILGTSLSGIDALMTVATACGAFVHDEAGALQFQASSGSEDFHAVMMSRKGLLPEADFYCPLPYLAPRICTEEAVAAEIARGSHGLLDRVFELFRQEIVAADADYAAEIGLHDLTADTFAEAYYGRRSDVDPFAWAGANLAEAEHNVRLRYTVPWRYAILITHEVIERAIRHLDTEDLKRFNRSFKSIFVDEYATVPHLSIKRLLALHNAGRLDILRLGEDYDIDRDGLARGARVRFASGEELFDSFIDATGQTALSARDLPFPTLLQQGGIKPAATPYPTRGLISDDAARMKRTGGMDLDDCYRPRGTGLLSNRLYCIAIPFLLHKHPFVQGMTSAAELAETAADAILADVAGTVTPQRLTA